MKSDLACTAFELPFPTREEWLAERRKGIGGSDAAAVLGESSRTSKAKLWADKRGMLEDEPEQPWHTWGHLLEAPIARHVHDVTGYDVIDPGPFTIYRHRDEEFRQCTPDRFLKDAGRPNVGLLQIKTAHPRYSGEWNDDPPLEYSIQVQHELAVLGLDWGILAVLIGNSDFRQFPVTRNDRFISALVNAEREFWKAVVAGEMPEADGSEGTREVLALLYPDDDGTEIELAPDVAHWAATWLATGEELKSLQTTRDLAEARIRASMGSATFATTPDGIRLSLKKQTQKAYVVEHPERSFRVLRKARKDGK